MPTLLELLYKEREMPDREDSRLDNGRKLAARINKAMQEKGQQTHTVNNREFCRILQDAKIMDQKGNFLDEEGRILRY
jgi:NAD(P)H-hydrate repair Nnr-like enzyme with NAD(P)H-hydrate dehydratase domain